jgi:hypothetical protein
MREEGGLCKREILFVSFRVFKKIFVEFFVVAMGCGSVERATNGHFVQLVDDK